jgi:hypothetical protein
MSDTNLFGTYYGNVASYALEIVGLASIVTGISSNEPRNVIGGAAVYVIGRIMNQISQDRRNELRSNSLLESKAHQG